MNSPLPAQRTCRYFLGMTACGTHDENGGCDFAALMITPDYAQRLLARIEAVATLKTQFSSIYRLVEFDGMPLIVSEAMLQSINLSCSGEWMEITAQQAQDIQALSATPIRAPEVECLSANYSDADVYWSMYARHTDIQVSTSSISRTDLAAIAGDGTFLVAQQEDCPWAPSPSIG
jgi:hypothetical protein